MGKHEKGTPKDIANRMKAKGLQKLRWYCQMCQKQCRDENGFKCHTTSESHQRQLLLFAENPDKYLDSFSEEFYEGYISLLKRRFGTKRVHANNVYQEYIHDRDHVHMNSTTWETLTDFVKWIGREGHCVVDETEKGWYVAYIDQDPETILREKTKRKKEKFVKDEEDRFQEFIEKQVQIGSLKAKAEEKVNSELNREESEVVTFNMNSVSKGSEIKTKVTPSNPLALKYSKSKAPSKSKKDDYIISKKKNTLAEIMEEDLVRKKREAKHQDNFKAKNLSSKAIKKDSPWIAKNIYVKVITKELGSKYYKAKGIVKDIVSDYAALVILNECGTKLKLDQTHLETVVPSIGRQVLILAGKYKNQTAILESIEVETFCASLKLSSDKIIEIPYEQFSKLAK